MSYEKQIYHSHLKKRAQAHVELMSMLYAEDIAYSIDNTRIYSGCPLQSKLTNEPDQVFVNTDTVSALYELYDPEKTVATPEETRKDHKICILNFASYKNPGGKYLEGSGAQEEMLCHESDLYNILSDKRFEDYYSYNRQHKNLALYTDRALYSKDVLFVRNGCNIKADVLTCAAPNYRVAGNYNQISRKANNIVLEQRIRFISEILADQKVNIFIAGAYGCGVFAQDPEEVACIWKNTLYDDSLKIIIHPVPGDNHNSQVFAKYFNDLANSAF